MDVNEIGTLTSLPVGKIKPAPDNPRKITDRAVEMVALSIVEFGWQQPIVVDTDHVVIAGHTRLRAAKSLNLKTVPVLIADRLTPAQVRAYRIADNRTSDFTSWDFPELTKQLEELSEDFSEVLALADWQAVIAEFNDLTENADSLEMDDAVADYISEEFKLTVVCDGEDTARLVAAAVMDMVGVVDVRDKR